MKLLEIGKDMKIKHSLYSPSTKYGGTFFHKEALHGGTNFFGQIDAGKFYMKTNDQFIQEG